MCCAQVKGIERPLPGKMAPAGRREVTLGLFWSPLSRRDEFAHPTLTPASSPGISAQAEGGIYGSKGFLSSRAWRSAPGGSSVEPPECAGSLKLVRPKALLDNCFRVMELLCPCCEGALEGLGLGLGYRCLSQVTRAGLGAVSTSSAPQGHRPFLEVEMDLRTAKSECGLVGVRELLTSPAASFVCLCVSSQVSSVLNWQDCGRLSLRLLAQLAQCEATQLYPLPQPPSTSLPRVLGPSAGPPTQ